ncbi:MAG: 4-oxalocrotonate tautomerase family protein [Thermodesulfobacteriota bacterium]
MPLVTVKLGPGRPVEIKRKIAGELTDVMVKNLDVKPEWVTVLFEELGKENWATGGKLHSEDS